MSPIVLDYITVPTTDTAFGEIENLHRFGLDDENPLKPNISAFPMIQWLKCSVTLLTCCFISLLIGLAWPRNLDYICFKHTAAYCEVGDCPRWQTLTGATAPIIESRDLKYHMTRFNNSLLHPTVYREDPGPQVDQAWQDLGINRMSSLKQPVTLFSHMFNHWHLQGTMLQSRGNLVTSRISLKVQSRHLPSLEESIPYFSKFSISFIAW
jgi:hypothetical protein